MNDIFVIAVKVLSQVKSNNDLSRDVIDIAIVCIICWYAVLREYDKRSDIYDDWLCDLVDESRHITISSMLNDFLEAFDNDTN